MRTLGNSTRISMLLAKRLGPLALLIGLLITLAAPSAYFLIEHRALRQSATLSARQLANHLHGIIMENPKLWKYQAQKYVALLYDYLPNKDVAAIRILDDAARPVTQYDYAAEAESPAIWWVPIQRGEAQIRFNNRVVGAVQVIVTSRAAMVRTLAFFMASLVLGTGVAFLAYRFPVTVVGDLEQQNQALTDRLKRSHSQLDARVKARTAELALANAALQRQIRARQISQAALVEAHSHLEERVDARTADLTAANRQLKLEINSRKLAQEALAASQEKLRFLSSKLLIVQEEERKRIAREIHDSLATTLSAIKFSVQKIKRDSRVGPTPEESLDRLIMTIQMAIDECRRIMSGLHPSSLDELGVISTLEWFCQDFEQRFSHIAVKTQISVSEKELPDAIKIVIYRLAQEAFHNVMQHSRASHVEISLTKGRYGIELSVADNGQGFDSSPGGNSTPPMRGLGILSMQERTENTGGAFSIETSAGRGTTVLATWPVEPGIATSNHAA